MYRTLWAEALPPERLRIERRIIEIGLGVAVVLCVGGALLAVGERL